MFSYESSEMFHHRFLREHFVATISKFNSNLNNGEQPPQK